MKSTKADLEKRCEALDREASVLRCALADTLRGEGKAFRNKYRTLRVSRPTSACGGIVVITDPHGLVSADYWERYSQDELRAISYLIDGTDTAYNRELDGRRAVINEAQQWVREQLKAEGMK